MYDSRDRIEAPNHESKWPKHWQPPNVTPYPPNQALPTHFLRHV
jgi:hypothetical protein